MNAKEARMALLKKLFECDWVEFDFSLFNDEVDVWVKRAISNSKRFVNVKTQIPYPVSDAVKEAIFTSLREKGFISISIGRYRKIDSCAYPQFLQICFSF